MRKTVSPPIALITDFGNRDWYVGSIKGQIQHHFPDAEIVDITHQIPAGNVWQASYVLSACINDFRSETLFMVVVDPGVGTSRECVLGRIGKHTVLCPNNGVISHSFQYNRDQHGPFYEILTERVIDDAISSTFHGRDVFAPIAGKIAAKSLNPEDLGPIMSNLKQLSISKPEFKKGVIHGTIQYIDHFGNVITDISHRELDLFKMKSSSFVEVKETKIAMKSTFDEVGIGEPLTYIGSTGFLEIATNRRHAAKQLSLKIGDSVSLHLQSERETGPSVSDILKKS